MQHELEREEDGPHMEVTRARSAAAALQAQVEKFLESGIEVIGHDSMVEQVRVIELAPSDAYVDVTFRPPPKGPGNPTVDALQWVAVSLADLGYEASDIQVHVPAGPNGLSSAARLDSTSADETHSTAPPKFDAAWLKALPLPWADKRMQKLQHHLTESFAAQTVDERIALIRTAGLSPAYVALEGAANEFWFGLLDMASRQGAIPQLLGAAHANMSPMDAAALAMIAA